MAVLAPIRLDHVKDTIRTVVVDALDDTIPAGQVVWSEQGIPRQPRPLAVLQLVSGPAPDQQLKTERRTRIEVDSVDVTVTSAIVGLLYRVRLNGIPLEYTAVGGDTVDIIRDRLRDLVNNVTVPVTKQSEAVTAVDGGAGAMSITPDVPGAIYVVEVNPGPTITAVTNLSGALATTHTVGRERMSIQVDVMTKGGSAIELGAVMLARRIVAAFDLESTLEFLLNNRVPVRLSGDLNNLTAIAPAGAEFEQREQFDLLAFVSSRVAESTFPIDIVDITIDIDGNIQSFTVTGP